IAKAPSSMELTPAMITRLTQSITERYRMDLLRCRAQRLGADELCAVDSTSRSAYGSSLADIHLGKNKERLPLEQTTEMVVYLLDSHMPVYYREFQGNIPDSRSVEALLLDVSHAGFPQVIFLTDRGYESLQNLERYILKGQPMIMDISFHQKLALDKIRGFGAIEGRPEGMDIDMDSRIYHRQYNLEYEVLGNGGVRHKADRMRLNLYFDPMRRSAELLNLDIDDEPQRRAMEEIKVKGLALDDDKSAGRNYNWFDIECDPENRKIISFKFSEKKVANAKKASGFFANVTLGLDKSAMEANEAYGLRDEQEKYFRQMKSQLHSDRQRNWSEDGKRGRMFILFVAMIIASQVKHAWATTSLRRLFASSLDVLDEMRAIRCIEHKGRKSSITPFVGAQVDICDAFGFAIPDGCAPKYRSRKVEPKCRGRPRKPAVEKLES
ncbi:MAG: transposase, partial [Bacteroidaceae bacterium]|nr:transposase [Bacteroidaceae bacterium]